MFEGMGFEVMPHFVKDFNFMPRDQWMTHILTQAQVVGHPRPTMLAHLSTHARTCWAEEDFDPMHSHSEPEETLWSVNPNLACPLDPHAGIILECMSLSKDTLSLNRTSMKTGGKMIHDAVNLDTKDFDPGKMVLGLLLKKSMQLRTLAATSKALGSGSLARTLCGWRCWLITRSWPKVNICAHHGYASSPIAKTPAADRHEPPTPGTFAQSIFGGGPAVCQWARWRVLGGVKDTETRFQTVLSTT
jgi:hypothetical protein